MYIDAIYERNQDLIKVVERINGERIYNEFPAEYVFYWEDPNGSYKTLWNQPCKRFSTNNSKTFKREMANLYGKKIHENDVNPLFRALETHYKGTPVPDLNIGFFDIEVDFDPDRGFANPWDPFARVTAISIHLSHLNELFTLVLKPELPKGHVDYMTFEEAEKITDKFSNCILCDTEENLLKGFFELIEDCDVLSGWNSTGFDIPYLVNRTDLILGSDYSKKFCLWNQRPKKRKYVKFKKEQFTYDLVGRVHLDYLELYQKHNTQEQHSYRLDFIGEIEVGENKVPYDGTLDMLYKKDFEKFIAYNRQDTALLVKIDAKKRFINLANQIAHTNYVLMKTTMGSVALIDQAIINYAHSLGKIAPGRNTNDDFEDRFDQDDDDDGEDKPVVGAFVLPPKAGMHQHIGCVDINSLYPSSLRSLNMSPETLVGQIRPDRTTALIEKRLSEGWAPKDVWSDMFSTLEFSDLQEGNENLLTVDFIDGVTETMPARDLRAIIYDDRNGYSVSANGTIFRTDVQGVVPGILAHWYSERKTMQGHKESYKTILEEGITVPEDMLEMLNG